MAAAKSRKSKAKKAVGRPSKYLPTFPAEAHELCLLGATDAELAEHFDVAESTINEWKHEHPEFSESIRAGKKIADSRVAASLYDRAKGAQWTEQHAFKVKRVRYENGKRASEDEEVVVVDVTKRAPPDTPAGKFWLTNRRPREWREKIEAQVSGQLMIISDLDALVGSEDATRH